MGSQKSVSADQIKKLFFRNPEYCEAEGPADR